METVIVNTEGKTEVHDLTDAVRRAVMASRVSEGIAIVSTPHTTTAVVVNEMEDHLAMDILEWAEGLAPTGAGYHHDRTDGNSHAHLRAVALGSSVALPVSGGLPVLGSWQSVLFIELDGPRSRRLHVQVVGQ